jgi:small subunit ribosomal protein S13
MIKSIKKKFGIGNSKIKTIISHCGLNPKVNSKNLKKRHLEETNKITQNFKLERNLKNEIKGRINFLLEHKTYKGVRHKLKYPVRGQRTRTNAKTTKKKTI